MNRMVATSPSRVPVTVLIALLPAVASAQAGEGYGQFAPKDAYLDGSTLAYYGSENSWDRRFFSAESAERAYKRRGQRQLLAILDGRPHEAAGWCRRRLAEDPDDAEALYMLTVAWCQLGEPEKALTSAKQAVAAGLPLGRFLAGPRELLRPLTTNQAFQDYLAPRPVRLIHGPMLGAVTDRSARFWVRTVAQVPVEVRVFKGRARGNPVATAVARSAADRDYTAVIEVTGLEPDCRYLYDVLVGDESVFGDGYPSFQTFSPKGHAHRFRIAFGGGAGYTPQHESMWDTIASFKPAALLLLGDNVYIDLPQTPGPLHQYTYYRRQSRPEFRRLVRSTPVYAIWDDHDAGIDDVWLGPYLDKPSWKQPTLALFKQNWNNPAYGDRCAPGCWLRLSIANVDLFLLDCRFYRTNPFAENPTMLGPVQKTWLLDSLRESRAELKLLVSSVPWASGAKPGSRDTWDGFPEEREEIFSWIEANRIDGVLLLSADRHRSDAWKVARPGAYPLYDLMSSRLTNMHRHECIKGALYGYNEKCSFGLLTFDMAQPDAEVTYQIVNIDGQIVYCLRLKKSMLAFEP